MTKEKRGEDSCKKGKGIFFQNLIRCLAAHDLPPGDSWDFQFGSGQHWILWFWDLVREVKFGGMKVLCLSFNELKSRN